MTLSDYIKYLQKLAKNKALANCELIVREDDEGNGYRQFIGLPSTVWIDKNDGYYIESVYYDDELNEVDSEQYKRVILIN